MRTPLPFTLHYSWSRPVAHLERDGASDGSRYWSRLDSKQIRLEEPSADLGPLKEASESDTGPGSTPSHRLASGLSAPASAAVARLRPSAIMKCAAIALALQGASGLVAPRLTVKSSALNAATLEVKSQRRSTSVILAKRSPCAPPAGPKTSSQRYRCTSSAAEQHSLQKAHRTHIRGPSGVAASRVAKKKS